MGYDQTPWVFKGQALYQLSLVRVEEARKYVPRDLPLVSAFGWTLGGFYLARYTDSPAGAFDELVALAGLAWDFPSSCAWAARVYVSSRAARDHGLCSVGLPSRMAAFKAVPLPALRGGDSGDGRTAASWWDAPLPQQRGEAAAALAGTAAVELSNREGDVAGWRRRGGGARGLRSPVCEIEMPRVRRAWSPRIHISLPSFSGATAEVPGLLKYSLRLMTNVRLISPVRVRLPAARPEGDRGSGEVIDAVLGGRPLLALSFEGMAMEVEAPEVWVPRSSEGSGKAGLAWAAP